MAAEVKLCVAEFAAVTEGYDVLVEEPVVAEAVTLYCNCFDVRLQQHVDEYL